MLTVFRPKRFSTCPLCILIFNIVLLCGTPTLSETLLVLRSYSVEQLNIFCVTFHLIISLVRLKILSLMMTFELQDVLFFIKSFKEPSTSFDIRNFIQFSSSRTRSATYLKMKYPFSTLISVKNFYFNRLPRLWNSLPPIDLDQPLLSIKKSLRTYFWNAFTSKFNVDSPCTYHLVCPCSKCALLPVPHNFHSTM